VDYRKDNSQFMPGETEAQMLKPDAVAAARKAAGRSMVLLKNAGGVLPLNPGGKLPVSFPYRVGQVPIYYNHEPTGRPCNKGVKWNSQHRDIPDCGPLFEFGHGLSYTTFAVSNLRLSSSSVSRHGSLTASVDVTDTGGRKGDEVVQLYIHDPVASISQPVRRLRGFERVTLDRGQTRTVTFRLDASDYGFYDNRGRFVVEPGQIDVYAGNSSSTEMKRTFTVR
jgi:beta-glucosidase